MSAGRTNVSGDISGFFGNGSDGTIPVLSSVTTAPNGGTVANLWDMNAGTVFTTGTLSSASDQVVFSIDFGKPTLLSQVANGYYNTLWQASLSTGVAKNIWLEWSNDNVSWTGSGVGSLTTTPTNFNLGGDQTAPHRYWRVLLKSGGSNCTVTIQGVTLNALSTGTDTQTTKVFRILGQSTLNGAAVVKQYTDFNLPAGYEITVQNPNQGLVIYSQNNITNAGVIDMSQKAGLAPNGNAIPMLITKTAYKTATTSSLLHFDNNITDAQGRTWTNNGAATFDATNKKFGTHAISFNGTNQWIDTPASDDFSFGSEDFTIDFWMRPTALSTLNRIFGSSDSVGNSFSRSVDLIKTAGNVLQLSIFLNDGTQLTLTSTSTIPHSGIFTHVEVSRYGNLFNLRINGNSESFAVSDLPIRRCTNKFSIGRLGEVTSSYFQGQIDEFRIIKGKAMYTANFTPPTSAYTYQATYIDTPKTLEKYFQLTNVLQTLRGGYGGNGGYGGGYSGATGRQTSVGIGGAGRQNLGGFGGGGSGGSAGSVAGFTQAGIGGSILFAELGGGKTFSCRIGTGDNSTGINGYNGAGATGGLNGAAAGFQGANTGSCFGGGSGGNGGSTAATPATSSADSQYAGGLVLLIVNGNISITGTVRANGGAGSNGTAGAGGTDGNNCGGGGGGGGAGGGVIALFHGGTYSNTGTVQVNGGAGGIGGAGSSTGEAGGAGTSGSVGLIHTQKL